MEKDFGFGYHHHPYFMLPNPSLLGFRIDTGHLYAQPVCENPRFFEQSTSRNTPLFRFSGLRNSNTNEPNNSQNLLYNTPRFHNTFPPVFHPAPKEKFPILKFGQRKSPTTGPTPTEKRFDTPVRFGPYLAPNFPTAYNLTREEVRAISNPLRPSTNGENVEEDELHEDTEELDALLCSDNDFSEDDDEETSTGHSPSTMTGNGARDLVDEEVDSFAGPTKRHKISDVGYNKVAGSLKLYVGSAPEDSDESVCDGDNYKRYKRLRREKVHETVRREKLHETMRREKVHETLRALQSLIPGVNGKDAIAVVDEAIRYLRSLKVEMMDLGVDAR